MCFVSVSLCVFACVCMCVCMRVCARAFACMCVCLLVSVWVPACLYLCVCIVLLYFAVFVSKCCCDPDLCHVLPVGGGVEQGLGHKDRLVSSTDPQLAEGGLPHSLHGLPVRHRAVFHRPLQ